MPAFAWAAGAATVAAGAAAGLRSPDAAALALAFLAPLLPGAERLLGGGMPLLFLFAAPALGASIVRRRLRGEASLLPAPVLRWGLAFLAVAGVSGLSSIVRGETLWRLLHGRATPHYVNELWATSAERSRDAVLLFLGYALLLAALDAFARLAVDPERRRRLLTAAAGGGGLAFATVLAERFIPGASRFDEWLLLGRTSGSFTDPNALGIGAALLAPLAAAALREGGPGRARLVPPAVLLLLFVPVLETSGSRTGLLLVALAAAVALAGLVRARVVPMRLVGAGLATLVVLSVAVWPFLPKGGSIAAGGLASRLAAAVRTGSVSAAVNQRTIFWQGAFDVIAEEPLSGCGLAGFAYEFPVRFSAKHRPVAFTDNPTNALLDVAAECGIPALLLALAAVVPLLVRAVDAALDRQPSPASSRAAGAAMIGFAAASMTGGHLRFPEIACLAALVAGLLFARRAAESAPDPDLAPPKRARAVLAFAGMIASLLVVWPTRTPDAAFRTEPWIGLHRPDEGRKGEVHRWMGPVALRRVQAGENRLDLTLENGRTDDLPVAVSVEVDGAVRRGLVLPRNGVESMTVGDLSPGQLVRFAAQPTFVPGRQAGWRDTRTLSLMLRLPSGRKAP